MAVTRLSGGLTPGDGADPRTFPAIWNVTAGEIETAQADIVTLEGTVASQGSAIDDIEAGLVSFGTSTGGTAILDFTDGPVLVSHQITTATVTISGVDYVAGSSRTVRLHGGTAVASLVVPSDWVFVGNAAGTSIGTATTVIMTATAFGTAATNVVAAYVEEA